MNKTRKWMMIPACTLVLTGTAAFTSFRLRDEADRVENGEVEPQLPTFSMQQVQQQAKGRRKWLVYRHGVYDVTDFAAGHPGGKRILQAAGKSVELFWQQSEPHARAGVSETLEELRIGNLEQEDFDRMQKLKGELGGDRTLGSDALKRFFFVEEMSAPEVDLDAFELKICSGDREEISLSLADLKTRFKQHRVTTTVRCAAPRASAGGAAKRVPTEWTGVLLADVLASVGAQTATETDHVWFEALDTDAQGRAFGTAMPATTALDRDTGVLLAYAMNGEPIPREHGYPLRVIVPGTTGARNVKFVNRIILPCV